MADKTVRGRFVWHELMTPNPEGAHDFYAAVLGWKKEPWEHDPGYLMFVASRGPLGAAYRKDEGSAQWLPYIGTEDVDATVEAARGLGARVETPPTPLPNGKYAVLADPQGALFGVHASASDPMPESAPQHGEFSWHELSSTADPVAVFEFYSKLFGWEEVSRTDMGAMGPYLVFGRDGTQLGGIFNRGQMGRPGPAYWLGYVSVPDLDGTIDKVKGAHGALLMEPMEVPGGDRIAQLADPHGALFALHWAAADAAKAPEAQAAQAPPREEVEPASAPAAKRPAKAKSAKKSTKKSTKNSTKKTVKKATAKKATAKKATAKKATAKKATKKRAAKAKPAARKKAKAAKKTRGKAAGKRAKKAAAKKRAGKKAARKAARPAKSAGRKKAAGKKAAKAKGKKARKKSRR